MKESTKSNLAIIGMVLFVAITVTLTLILNSFAPIAVMGGISAIGTAVIQ